MHRRLFILHIISAVVFLWFSLLVTADSQPMFDTWVFAMREVFMSDVLMNVMSAISVIFDPVTLSVATIILFEFLLLFHKKRYAVLLLFAVTGALVSTVVLKAMFDIDRPESGITVMGNSFPSGHATGATVFFLTLLFIVEKKFSDSAIHFLLACFMTLLVVLTGASRLYLGVHWASDVVAGFALGMFWITLSFILLYFVEYRHARNHS